MNVLQLALLDARRRLGRYGLALSALVLGATLGLRAAETRLREGWIFPTDDAWGELRSFWMPASFVLGLVALGVERWAGAREVLLHRGTSRARLASARLLAGLGALLALLAAGYLAPGPVRALFDADGVLLSARRCGERALLATVCLAAFGAGAYTATARAGFLGRVLLAIVGFAVVSLAAHALVEAPLDAFAGSWSAYTAANLALAALFLQAAHAGYLCPADLDRPLDGPRLAREAPAAAGAMALLSVLFVPLAQSGFQDGFVDRWPGVARTDAGELELREPDLRRGGERLFGPSAELRTRRQGLLQRLWPERVHFGDPPHLGARMVALGHVYPWIRSFLERPSGRVHTWYLAANERAHGSTGHVVHERDASGAPLPPTVEIVAQPGPFGVEHVPVLLGDRASGALWSYDFTDPTAVPERLPLPDGDRYGGWAESPSGGRHDVLVRGATALYAVERGPDDTSADASADDGSQDGARPTLTKAFAFAPAEPEVEATWLDPLALDVVVTDGTGARLVHAYRPRGPAQRAFAVLAQAYVAARPPLAVLAGHLGIAHGPQERGIFRRTFLVDPLVRDGRRRWLVGLSLLLSAVVARHFAARLRAAGAEPWRRRAWVAAVLLGGPAIGFVALVLEPRQAWRALPAPAPAPRPCIRSLETPGGVS